MTATDAAASPVAGILDGSVPMCEPGAVELAVGVLGCTRDRRTGHLWSVARTAGTSSVATAGVFLDHALGEATFAHRPAGSWGLTSELTVDVLEPGPWPGSTLVVESWADRVEVGCAHAAGRLLDGHGRVLATGSTWMTFVDGGGAAARSRRCAPPVPGPVPDEAGLADRLGLRMAGGVVHLGTTAPWQNAYGVLHGGVWFGLAATAGRIALDPGGGELVTARVHVSYLRAAVGAGVTAEAEVLHRGRRRGEARVLGRDGAGRICTSATVSTRLAGRPTSGEETS